jgi:hypothetical protein
MDWCQEGYGQHFGHGTAHGRHRGARDETAVSKKRGRIDRKLTGTTWWQGRSPSVTIDRKTADYLRVLQRVLMQANSLMFIDPNLDPSGHNYREFWQLT